MCSRVSGLADLFSLPNRVKLLLGPIRFITRRCATARPFGSILGPASLPQLGLTVVAIPFSPHLCLH